MTAPNDTLLNTIGIPTVGGNYFSLHTLGALVGMIRIKIIYNSIEILFNK